MKTTNAILLSIIICMFIACSSGTEPNEDNVPQPFVNVFLLYLDENGNSLLNPDRADAWNEDNIEIYYLIEGEKERVYESHQKYPKNLQILYNEDENTWYLSLVLSSYIEDNHTTTFIEFTNGDIDTLKIHAKEVNGGVRTDKFWYNDELLFAKDDIEYYTLGIYEFTKSVN